MTIRDRRAIVAVDPSPRGLAYVFFERGELLDWGHRRCGRNQKQVLAFLAELLLGCAVDVLVIEAPDAPQARRSIRAQRLLEAMRKRALTAGVTVVPISRFEVRKAWAAKGLMTKEGVANALATDFPELAALVPPRRRSWMSEHPNVNVFDALTLLLRACN
jgi:hypothetical protein